MHVWICGSRGGNPHGDPASRCCRAEVSAPSPRRSSLLAARAIDILKSYKSRPGQYVRIGTPILRCRRFSFATGAEQSAAHTGRIWDRLRSHFGPDDVFIDVNSVPLGVDFRGYIASRVSESLVLLAVMGPNWVGKTIFRRQISNPKDFVRMEVEAALVRSIPVIPILIDGAMMPGEKELPPTLGRLAFCSAIKVDQGSDFNHHIGRLIEAIERFVQLPGSGDQMPELAGPLPASPSIKDHTQRKSELSTDDAKQRMPVPEGGVGPQVSRQPSESVKRSEPNRVDATNSIVELRSTRASAIASEYSSRPPPSVGTVKAWAVGTKPQAFPKARRRVPGAWFCAAAQLFPSSCGRTGCAIACGPRLHLEPLW